MNTRSVSFAVIIAALSLTAFAGCYTKLMPFREAVEMRRASTASTSGGTTTGELNYSENCTSCHSEAELADRAQEVNREDFYAIHGVQYDPYGWQNPYVQPPWWDPTPPILIPVGGGSLPVITTGGGASNPQAAPAKNANRTRESGSKRDGSRERVPVQASPTTSASPAPSTPSTPSSPPPPTTNTPVPTVSTPPAQQNTPPPQSDTRTRSNGSEDTRTRRSGSGRE